MKGPKKLSFSNFLPYVFFVTFAVVLITPVAYHIYNDKIKEKYTKSGSSILSAAKTLSSSKNAAMAFKFINGVDVSVFPLNYRGIIPKNGFILIHDDGTSEMSIYEEGYCIYKTKENPYLNVSKKLESDCKIVNK